MVFNMFFEQSLPLGVCTQVGVFALGGLLQCSWEVLEDLGRVFGVLGVSWGSMAAGDPWRHPQNVILEAMLAPS